MTEANPRRRFRRAQSAGARGPRRPAHRQFSGQAAQGRAEEPRLPVCCGPGRSASTASAQNPMRASAAATRSAFRRCAWRSRTMPAAQAPTRHRPACRGRDHFRRRGLSRPRQAGRRRQPRRQRHQLRRDRAAARGAAERIAGTRASARSRHERRSRARAQAQRVARAAGSDSKTATSTKQYLALLRGKPPRAKFDVNVPLRKSILQGGERMVRVDDDGKPALTTFKIIDSFADASLAEVTLHTGRTHQIRVHSQYVGFPVAGDEKYGSREINQRLREFGLRRLFLHAARFEFARPNGKSYAFSAPLGAGARSGARRATERPYKRLDVFQASESFDFRRADEIIHRQAADVVRRKPYASICPSRVRYPDDDFRVPRSNRWH